MSSCGRFESAIKRTTHAPSAPNAGKCCSHANPASDCNETPGVGPCIPPRCPTVGTLVVPLVPLVRYLGAWPALPSLSRWLLQTIRLGYAIQFDRRPPKFIHFTSVERCLFLACTDHSHTGEGCDRAGPSSQYEDTLTNLAHPQTVQLIWRHFGVTQVGLFSSLETSHCQLFHSLSERTLGTDALSHSWPQAFTSMRFHQ